MDFMFWVWLGVIILTAVIEFATMDMTSIWFTAGAIPSLIMSAIGGVHWAIQLSTFFVLSAVLLISLRKMTKRFLFKHNEKTNLDLIVGKEYKLISPIGTDFMGSIKINGIVWSVTTLNRQEIDEGSYVKVVKVEGNKFIVERAANEKKQAANDKTTAEAKVSQNAEVIDQSQDKKEEDK